MTENCSILAGHDQLALLNEAEYSIIELAQFSQSLANGRTVFTGRGSYVLLSIDSKFISYVAAKVLT